MGNMYFRYYVMLVVDVDFLVVADWLGIGEQDAKPLIS